MSHFPHGAFVAIHAAQEQQRQDRIEEEEMTKYSVEELEGDWEFKIVRSTSGAFRRPDVFQSLLEEESLAGWELVEKLDDRRVRFKRRKDARRRDATLPTGIDPYRSQYGRDTVTTAVVMGIVIAIVLGLGILFFAMGAPGGGVGDSSSTFPVIIAAVGVFAILVGMLVVIAARRRR
jgi:hypothetical protein